MVRIRLDVETKQPVVLARSHFSGNIVYTLDYIPGSALRGAMASRFIERHGKPEDNWGKFKKYFCSDMVRFENIYMAEGSHYVFPIPLSSKTCKAYNGFLCDDEQTGSHHGVSDYLTKGIPDYCPKCKHETPLENITGFYSVPCPDSYTQIKSVDLKKRFSIHNEIEDETQRTKEGILYTLEQIGEEQEFTGSIICADKGIRDDFTNDVIGEDDEFYLYVGQARSRGMGQIGIKGAFDDFSLDQGFFPPLEERFNEFDENCFSVTLYSDVILVDEYLRSLTYLSSTYLSKILKVELDLVKTFSSYHIVSGWHSGARLPKEDDVAISRGSTFLFRYNGNEREELVNGLKTLEEEGIGLRRNEGFGRLIICDPYHLNVNELEGT
jgi:CRISPR/Cas system CSM-associated protein Csm3 (group 7 of RAMP superfamily)